MPAIEELESRLLEACSARMFSYYIHYSDADGCYYAQTTSVAPSEFTEVKRAPTLREAIVRLTARVEEKFPLNERA